MIIPDVKGRVIPKDERRLPNAASLVVKQINEAILIG